MVRAQQPGEKVSDFAVEREALAAIKEFYPYLYEFSFTMVTDHNPLTSLKGLKDIARWLFGKMANIPTTIQFSSAILFQKNKLKC